MKLSLNLNNYNKFKINFMLKNNELKIFYYKKFQLKVKIIINQYIALFTLGNMPIGNLFHYIPSINLSMFKCFYSLSDGTNCIFGWQNLNNV